jgi:hypothetical protein
MAYLTARELAVSASRPRRRWATPRGVQNSKGSSGFLSDLLSEVGLSGRSSRKQWDMMMAQQGFVTDPRVVQQMTAQQKAEQAALFAQQSTLVQAGLPTIVMKGQTAPVQATGAQAAALAAAGQSTTLAPYTAPSQQIQQVASSPTGQSLQQQIAAQIAKNRASCQGQGGIYGEPDTANPGGTCTIQNPDGGNNLVAPGAPSAASEGAFAPGYDMFGGGSAGAPSMDPSGAVFDESGGSGVDTGMTVVAGGEQQQGQGFWDWLMELIFGPSAPPQDQSSDPDAGALDDLTGFGSTMSLHDAARAGFMVTRQPERDLRLQGGALGLGAYDRGQLADQAADMLAAGGIMSQPKQNSFVAALEAKKEPSLFDSFSTLGGAKTGTTSGITQQDVEGAIKLASQATAMGLQIASPLLPLLNRPKIKVMGQPAPAAARQQESGMGTGTKIALGVAAGAGALWVGKKLLGKKR